MHLEKDEIELEIVIVVELAGPSPGWHNTAMVSSP